MSLPEILENIFGHLDDKDLFNLLAVNHTWRSERFRAICKLYIIIIQTLNLERVRLSGDSWHPFIVLPEAKDPAEMGQRRLDLLIRDGRRYAIELKVDTMTEDEVNEAISQIED